MNMQTFRQKKPTTQTVPVKSSLFLGAPISTRPTPHTPVPPTLAIERAVGSTPGRDFSRVPAHPTAPELARTKSPAGSVSEGEEVSQTPAPPGSAEAAPIPLGDEGAAKAKKAELKSGPTYSPSGTIKAKAEGSVKKAKFNLSAEFKHDPASGVDASLGEVRQYIRWTADPPPNNAGFKPATDYKANTWYEDRDSAGKRYGHRSGTHAECVSINHYENAAGKNDCAAGPTFKGEDTPTGASSRTGEWQFELRAIDRGNGDKEIGTPATVSVAWD